MVPAAFPLLTIALEFGFVSVCVPVSVSCCVVCDLVAQPVLSQIGNDLVANVGFTDTNTWHHVAMAHEQTSGQRTIFLDGSLIGVGTLPASAPFNPPYLTVTIGKSGTLLWKGWIDGHTHAHSHSHAHPRAHASYACTCRSVRL